MSLPYMKFYVGDYQRDTRHLSTEEHGAYLLILLAMWSAGGRLPNDDLRLARIAGLTPAKWKKIGPVVRSFLTIEGEFVTQKKLSEIAQKEAEKVQILKSNGSKGGAAKALKTKKPDVANATPNATANALANGVTTITRTKDSNPTTTFDSAERACLDAAGDVVGWGLAGDVVFGHVWRLVEAEQCDLELDVIPTIRDVCANARKRGAKIAGWRYFTDAIRRARDERLEGVRKIPKAKPKPRTFEEWTDEEWQGRLGLSRTTGVWYWTSGPAPFTEGCRCPEKLLDRERDSGYTVEKPPRSAAG